MGFYCGGKYVSDEDFGTKNLIKGKNKFTGEAVAIKRWSKGSSAADCEIDLWRKVYTEHFSDEYEDFDYKYFIREWITGDSLTDFCLSGQKLDDVEVSKIICEICDALLCFYKYTNMVYCDLKPDNIIVSKKNEELAIFLVDFESAKREFLLSADTNVRLFAEKTIHFASKDYCAPEIYHGECSFASDVYSLGKILLFLSTGVPRSSMLEKLPCYTREICEKCIQTETDKRYKNAKDVKLSLKQLIESREFTKKSAASFSQQKERHPFNKPYEESVNVFEVENMTVNAKNFKYREENISQSLPFETEDSEPNEAKVLMFPRNMIGYRRLILFVPDNIAFAAELAYISARVFGLKAAVFDMNGCYKDRLRYYLRFFDTAAYIGIPEYSGESGGALLVADNDCKTTDEFASQVSQSLFCEEPEIWRKRGLLSVCDGLDNLYLSSCNIAEELELFSGGLRNFASWCYGSFDVTVLLVDCRFDEKRCAKIMRNSDYVIVPVLADADEIVAEKNFFTGFMSRNAAPMSKLCYVGWDFSENESADYEAMVMSLGKNKYLGTVFKDPKRRRTKNIEGKSYCELNYAKLKSQYCHLINQLMFNKAKSA